MTFKHTFLTWVVAHVLHVLAWICYGLCCGTTLTSFIHDDFFGELIVFSVLCSIPCLLLAWPLLIAIVNSSYTRNTKFALWLCTLLLIIMVAMIFIMVRIDDISAAMFAMTVPPLAGTTIAVLVRYKQFQQLIDALHPEEFEHTPTETI